jgi:hypothetical protein
MNKLWQTIQNWRNLVDFRIREWFRWQRSGLKFENQKKDDLFDFLSGVKKEQAEQTAARLINQYHLQFFSECSTRINFRENLFYLSMLENAFDQAGIDLPAVLNAADIGPAHWFYVQALYAGLTWYGVKRPRQVNLIGYEADAYRVFSSFYSRMDYTKAHIRNLPVVYRPEHFKATHHQFDLVFMFFPFVFIKDHLAWGLPKRQFDPLSLRRAVCESLTAEGKVLVVNQGLEEHLAEKENFQKLGMKIIAEFEQDDLLYQYDLKRFVLVVKNE